MFKLSSELQVPVDDEIGIVVSWCDSRKRNLYMNESEDLMICCSYVKIDPIRFLFVYGNQHS